MKLTTLASVSILGLALAGTVGCGGPPAPPSPPVADPSAALDKEAMKTRLEQIAASGQAGSGIGGLKEGIQKLGNPELLKDVEMLEKETDPAKITAIAKRMAAKL